MKYTCLSALTAALLALGTLPSSAEGDGWGPGFKRYGGKGHYMQTMFDRLDANGDGAITMAESKAMFSDRFKKADANADGLVSKSEIIVAIENQSDHPRLSRFSGRIADKLVYRFDVNADGKVSLEEIDNRLGKRFALLDFNDDDKVDADEMRRAGDRKHGLRHWSARWHHNDRGAHPRSPNE